MPSTSKQTEATDIYLASYSSLPSLHLSLFVCVYVRVCEIYPTGMLLSFHDRDDSSMCFHVCPLQEHKPIIQINPSEHFVLTKKKKKKKSEGADILTD